MRFLNNFWSSEDLTFIFIEIIPNHYIENQEQLDNNWDLEPKESYTNVD